MQTQIKRIYNLFPNGGDYPIIDRIPLFDQLLDENDFPISARLPIPYEKLDDEITIQYEKEIMTLTEFKQKIVSFELSKKNKEE